MNQNEHLFIRKDYPTTGVLKLESSQTTGITDLQLTGGVGSTVSDQEVIT